MQITFTWFIAFTGGLYAIFCAVKDYDWFMSSSRAWGGVKLFGRDGAWVFYVALGVFLVVASFMI